MRESAKAHRRKETALGYFFLGPQLVGLLVFMLGPLVFALVLGFSNWDGFGTMTFAGLKNFATVFTDPQLVTSSRNTVWFAVLSVPGQLLSGFIVAWMLQKVVRGKSFYRTFYFAPVVTSSVAVAVIWLWLLNPDISPLNTTLKKMGLPAPDWLQDARFTIPAFAVVAIWQGIGYQVVMFSAGLENVPKSLLEAADIDGANEWQKMRKITVPLLSPTILFLSITGIIGSFQIFDLVFVLMGTNAPSASRTIVYEIYQKAFVEFNFGVACAIAIVLFLALLALTGLQLAAQKRWVHYTE
ncbi:carbohydrate ABC transporter permease [Microlunatus panaciterrae]|nr:sugar ABC transporter permease [Microlunatus panaciterrae]